MAPPGIVEALDVVEDVGPETVRHIFIRYLELKAVRELQEEIAAAGIRSKQRVRSDGSVYGGQVLGRGALYQMLQNRIYRGEITHKGAAYPGQHPAIVDQDLWDRVQATLAENRVERASGAAWQAAEPADRSPVRSER